MMGVLIRRGLLYWCYHIMFGFYFAIGHRVGYFFVESVPLLESLSHVHCGRCQTLYAVGKLYHRHAKDKYSDFDSLLKFTVMCKLSILNESG